MYREVFVYLSVALTTRKYMARVIGQEFEMDGQFKRELTDVAIVLGKRVTEIKDGIKKNQEKQTEGFATLCEKIEGTQSLPEVKRYYLFDVKHWMEWLIWGISIALIACTIGCYLSPQFQSIPRKLRPQIPHP